MPNLSYIPPSATPFSDSAQLLDFATTLTDIYARHLVPCMVSLKHWPRQGWRLITLSPWQRTPELLAELKSAGLEHMFGVFVAHFDQGDYMEVWIPLPSLDGLGSPITDPITNPTA